MSDLVFLFMASVVYTVYCSLVLFVQHVQHIQNGFTQLDSFCPLSHLDFYYLQIEIRHCF